MPAAVAAAAAAAAAAKNFGRNSGYGKYTDSSTTYNFAINWKREKRKKFICELRTKTNENKDEYSLGCIVSQN